MARRHPDPAPGGGLESLPGEDGEGEDLLADLAAIDASADCSFAVDAAGAGVRIDRFLAQQLPQVSRSRIQQWIEAGAVQRNGSPARSRDTLIAGDRIGVQPIAAPQSLAFVPEAMPLAVVWEDETLIILDKPVGLVVHPGAGNWHGTLLNGLLAYDPKLAQVPRAGIVHRLDAGTSGLLVVARTPAAQLDLVRQLQARSVLRQYWALVAGAMAPSVTIDAPIARDPRNPLRFCVSRAARARPARTFARTLAQWKSAGSGAVVSWIACRLDTGRTHQIRVHLESIGHPLLGDPVYRRRLPATLSSHIGLGHQALHACGLALTHPLRGARMHWTSAPPEDMRALMLALGARASQLQASLQEFAAADALATES